MGSLEAIMRPTESTNRRDQLEAIMRLPELQLEAIMFLDRAYWRSAGNKVRILIRTVSFYDSCYVKSDVKASVVNFVNMWSFDMLHNYHYQADRRDRVGQIASVLLHWNGFPLRFDGFAFSDFVQRVASFVYGPSIKELYGGRDPVVSTPARGDGTAEFHG